MADQIEIRFEGFKRLISKLEKLEKRDHKSVVRKAVRAGARPVMKKAKRDAPTRAIKHTMWIKTKYYKSSGVYAAIIGPKRSSRKNKFLKGGVVRKTKKEGMQILDAWYAHIIEGGADPHKIRPSYRYTKKEARRPGIIAAAKSHGWYKPDATVLTFMGRGGRLVSKKAVSHPGIKGTNFLRNAYRARRRAGLSAFRLKIGEALDKIKEQARS